jgi:hypothetical protein
MDEERPLDIFLQPSRRLLLFSLLFILSCFILWWMIPASFECKILLFFVMLVGIVIEIRKTVLLASSRSIIRIGYDGGMMNSVGHISEVRWWYQCRHGAKTYSNLSKETLVWQEWVVLDFGRFPVSKAVVIARDSVENAKDFQRLKRLLRSA